MKRSKYRDNKKGNSSCSTSPQSSKQREKSVILKVLLFIIVLIVGATSFIFLFPEIARWYPALSFLTDMRFFSSISTFFTYLWEMISTSLQSVFLSIGGTIIFLLVITFLIFCIFSPYVKTKNQKVFCQRKMCFPFYRVTRILLVNSIGNDIVNKKHFAYKVHENFSQTMALNIDHVQMVISKYESTLSIYFLVSMKGFSRKKLRSKIRQEMLFLSNLLTTYYESSSEILTVEQTKLLFQVLKEMRIKVPLDISSLEETDIDMMELVYKTISNQNFPNITLLLRVKKKEKESTTFLLQFYSFSDDVQTLKYFRHATSFPKKKNVFRLKRPQTVFLDKLSKYFHLPLDYQGTAFVLKPREKTTIQREHSILLGYGRTGLTTDEVLIGIEELLYNIEIYGMIGRGKTRLVCGILDQLIRYQIPCLIFDVKGEYAATFVDEPNVEIYTIGQPHPLCINLFDTKDEDDVRSTLLIIEEMMVTSSQEFSPSMKNLFENALFLTHKADERTLETFVENLIALAKQTSHISSIQHTLDAVLNRLNYIFNPINFEILGVKETTLDFDLLDQGKSLIFDLSQFQRRAARPSDIFLICNLILKLFYRFASTGEFTNKLRYIVVLEEAINVIPNFYRTESSASLITAENNFLLGRSLGIGHLTISQMWDSVSNIVHANSSTKIVFRSNQAIKKIANAFNLPDDRFKLVQQLPIRHCLVWIDGQDQALEMTTLDFSRNPLNYSQCLQVLESKYPSFTCPLLYTSFIDMRTSLYEKLGKANRPSRKEGKSKKNEKENRSKQTSKKRVSPLITVKSSVEQSMSSVLGEHTNTQDDVCNTFCSSNMNKQKCLDYRKNAQLVCSNLMKRYTKYEIEQAILEKSHITIEELLKQVLLERKLVYNDYALFCAKRELVNHLMK